MRQLNNVKQHQPYLKNYVVWYFDDYFELK